MIMGLKSCPFCGHKDLSVNELLGEWWVECNWCNSTGGDFDRESFARMAWNRRNLKPANGKKHQLIKRWMYEGMLS